MKKIQILKISFLALSFVCFTNIIGIFCFHHFVLDNIHIWALLSISISLTAISYIIRYYK